ncbi:putative GNAT family N-acyltransferase [Chromohalobacter marismortui]|uniref:Putative GNAT family N-acyltransferase n=1 Tax=Chromohalobacter marismortui TaxID=42055 RepID=A0A4R7NJ02_9GAMM|nr:MULTISPECIES: GNAT family N-acetyltransferase [Chromohalobacter]MCI0511428.1 GNAT family N-acetyltransferase [Chromohalobacter sp.]MCI0592475.1 GNAT family N-acetyltransferase [Chromohalobacter sp.]TDU20369.1 putative GNAT family N-acyltransferase [Chromohalobacter marismortui]
MTMREWHVASGNWETLGTACSAIRKVVFIEEQHVPQAEEWDGRDPQCRHFLLHVGDRAMGTARLLPDGHIGRVAILAEARGQGLGLRLMEAVMEEARQQGHDAVHLDAQTYAIPFYERLGFVAHGETFLDANIPHRHMSLTFQ